jgi:hypothetical protein
VNFGERPPGAVPILVIEDERDSPLMHLRVYCGRCHATISARTVDARTTPADTAADAGDADAAAWLAHHCAGGSVGRG